MRLPDIGETCWVPDSEGMRLRSITITHEAAFIDGEIGIVAVARTFDGRIAHGAPGAAGVHWVIDGMLQ
jgi:hypothetical protein